MLPTDELELLGRRAAHQAQGYIDEVLGLTPGRPIAADSLQTLFGALMFVRAHLDAYMRKQFPMFDLDTVRSAVYSLSDQLADGYGRKVAAAAPADNGTGGTCECV